MLTNYNCSTKRSDSASSSYYTAPLPDSTGSSDVDEGSSNDSNESGEPKEAVTPVDDNSRDSSATSSTASSANSSPSSNRPNTRDNNRQPFSPLGRFSSAMFAKKVDNQEPDNAPSGKEQKEIKNNSPALNTSSK